MRRPVIAVVLALVALPAAAPDVGPASAPRAPGRPSWLETSRRSSSPPAGGGSSPRRESRSPCASCAGSGATLGEVSMSRLFGPPKAVEKTRETKEE
jgi:hypothetical protein